MEAAVCTSVAHRNVVLTYHYDIKPVRADCESRAGLQVEMGTQATDWKL